MKYDKQIINFTIIKFESFNFKFESEIWRFGNFSTLTTVAKDRVTMIQSSFFLLFPDFGDRQVTSFRMVDEQSVTGVGRITIQEDFGVSNSSSVGCSSGLPDWWKDLRQRMRNCLPTNGNGGGNNSNEVLVEVKQVRNTDQQYHTHIVLVSK